MRIANECQEFGGSLDDPLNNEEMEMKLAIESKISEHNAVRADHVLFPFPEVILSFTTNSVTMEEEEDMDFEDDAEEMDLTEQNVIDCTKLQSVQGVYPKGFRLDCKERKKRSSCTA